MEAPVKPKAPKPTQDTTPEESNISRLNTAVHRFNRYNIAGSGEPGGTETEGKLAKDEARGFAPPPPPPVRPAGNNPPAANAAPAAPKPANQNPPPANPAPNPAPVLPPRAKKAPPPPAEGEEDGDLTSRLLRAKQRAHDERKK